MDNKLAKAFEQLTKSMEAFKDAIESLNIPEDHTDHIAADCLLSNSLLN